MSRRRRVISVGRTGPPTGRALRQRLPLRSQYGRHDLESVADLRYRDAGHSGDSFNIAMPRCGEANE